jgi:DNA (cytosine-5)-methyltransferase 1
MPLALGKGLATLMENFADYSMPGQSKLTAIDLFAGCGGISAGLRQAGLRVIAGLDVWETALRTYRENFPKARAMNADISELSAREFMRELGLRKGELFLLAGGPPCQGFSKNVPRRHRYLEDPRNRLVRSFLDYAEALRPAIVLMENVAEFKNGFEQAYTSEIEERLGGLGYHVEHAVLAAHDYGVPQRRRRAFFLATRHKLASAFPTVTHADSSKPPTLFTTKLHVSVWDAIGDLPALNHGESYDGGDYSIAPFSDFQRRVRLRSRHIINHVARKLQPTQFARLSALEPGQGIKELPDFLRPKSGYSGAYGRLTKAMIAPTITRWVFHPGSGRFGHPVDIRLITMREAARIQGFSDDFSFVGSYIEQSHQIGNAVPPMLAEAIARHLRKQTAS